MTNLSALSIPPVPAEAPDFSAGNGNVSLAAARRFCDVTSADYVPALLECGRQRAEGDELEFSFEEAEAEQQPLGVEVVISRQYA